MKRLLSVLMVLALLLIAGCATEVTPAPSSPPDVAPEATPAQVDEPAGLKFTPGTYTKEAAGMHGPITVEVTVDEKSILDAKVTSTMETPGMGDYAGEEITKQVVAYQSLDVDTVAGATISSAVVKKAVSDCLADAGGDIALLSAAREREDTIASEYTADVIIIGGGGAGLTAAATALEEGASVVLVEKTDILGGNSLVVGGFMNAPMPELQDHAFDERSASIESLVTDALAETPISDEHAALQKAVKEDFDAYLKSDKTLFDSANWFALQTWNGGDKLGTLPIVQKLTGSAYDMMQWLISNGMEFRDDVVLGGGALYTRSRYAIQPNGLGYITAIRTSMEKNAGANLTVLTNTQGTELIMDGDKVVGATALDRATNKEITLHANKAVILSTGGFAGNVELRVKYCQSEKWPDLGSSVLTTNTSGVTGDGIFMAEKAGAELVNMDQIQLLPYCNPQTGILNDVMGGGDGREIFINKEGKRFVREDGRRDDMSKAIIAQTDGVMYILTNSAGVGGIDLRDIKTLGGQSVSYFLDNNLYGYIIGDTLQDIADQLGFPVENLEETLATYNSNVTAGTADEFHRVTYVGTIEEGPYIAFPRKPAAHHTMGGVRIDIEAHALRADGSVIGGLYCAGEITGVVHGTNRIGGNAIVDYLTFGREAGYNAANEQ
ncbi:FAD-dependent oxidoreductase [Christensenellaceae bacterium OttesenSCG-928-M15]|nr:FAD-dependent oxidoreductase [Christensenellaceae bacterium OttesenSCG-928-M15]